MLVAIYWNNHHHMLHMTKRINGRILWANNHLLFWLSLIPFCTLWHGEHLAASLPAAIYGGVLFMAGISYTILSTAIIRDQGEGSPLKAAVGNDLKGWTVGGALRHPRSSARSSARGSPTRSSSSSR